MAKESINRVEEPFLVKGFSETEFVNIVMNDDNITIKVPFPIDLALYLSADEGGSFLDMVEKNYKEYRYHDLISHLEGLTREFWDYTEDDFNEDIESGRAPTFNGVPIEGDQWGYLEIVKYFEYGIGGAYFDWDDIPNTIWDCGDNDILDVFPELNVPIEEFDKFLSEWSTENVRYVINHNLRLSIDLKEKLFYIGAYYHEPMVITRDKEVIYEYLNRQNYYNFPAKVIQRLVEIS